MTGVAEIKEAIRNLTAEELAEVADWVYDLAGDEWDRQIEADAAAGRLEFLKERVAKAKVEGTLGDL